MTPGQMITARALALLWANCHRVVHAKRPWLAVDELSTTVTSFCCAIRDAIGAISREDGRGFFAAAGYDAK